MFMQLIRLASRHPEIWIDAKKYTKLTGVAGFRFELHSMIAPTAIRLRVNNHTIAEQLLNGPTNNNNANRDFINVWSQPPILEKPDVQLCIELKFFGVYFCVKTLDVYWINPIASDTLLKSDAFIDTRPLQIAPLSTKDLTHQIESLASVVRPMCSKQLRRNINKILIFRLDQLGDFILTVPAIVRLKSIFGDAEITALVSPANVDCARSLNLFSEIVEVPFSFQTGTNKRFLSDEARDAVVSSSHSKIFDLAIDLSVMPESRPLLALINADYKIGFENTNTFMMDLGVLFHAKDPVNVLSNISHATYPMLMVEAARLALKPDYAHILPNENAVALLDNFNLRPKNYVVVHSGARNILARWPQENFVTLATEIAARGEAVVFFSDDPVPDHLQARLQQAQIQVFSGGMTFAQFDAILSFARVYIGNDTGPKHLAALRDVPVVSIHAARSNWSEWGQVDSGYTISRRVPCAGCGIETKRECGRDLVCLNNIAVQEVFDCYSSIE
jgi:ADP-heptose:LPS heptosyltransferase